MPKESFADTVHVWESLLGGLEGTLEDLPPNAEALRAKLQKLLERSRALQNQRAALVTKARKLTRELREATAAGKDAASRLRAGLRSQYGSRAPKLQEFGVSPQRPYPKRKPAEKKST